MVTFYYFLISLFFFRDDSISEQVSLILHESQAFPKEHFPLDSCLKYKTEIANADATIMITIIISIILYIIYINNLPI